MTTRDTGGGTRLPENFFGKLFDFSFKTFITTSIIPVIYILLVILAGFGALAVFISFANNGGGAAVVGLILAPLFFIFYVLLGRVWLEVLIVMFRIAENTEEMARALRERADPSSL